MIVLDNLSAYKAASIRETYMARLCDLLFLLLYSQDLIPIEQAFSKLKAILHSLGVGSQDTLHEAIRRDITAPRQWARLVLQRVTPPVASQTASGGHVAQLCAAGALEATH